ncbi:septum formation initiator family protein [Pontibacter sp. G13]|uniref:FtsB family cell division protein n=1 Tax=Pontibacter sp. G13 TaxID=3074898 RepID=UPI00288A2F2F|nr:septum formation initiator family protein [Pontibacter sp. G13]WNJ20530.1 septum formation initiator family protein [Pontibacter sp. G13]
MQDLKIFLFRIFQRLRKASLSKYIAVLLAAGIWMLAFDRLNLISRYRVQQQIETLKQDKAHYQSAIKSLDYQEGQLFSDPEQLERFARERYHFKRSREDVFVIVPKADSPQ